MKLSKFLGRILLALLFVNAGLRMLQDPEPYIRYVNVRYPVVHNFTTKLIGEYVQICDCLKPESFVKHTACLIQSLAWAQIVLAFGVGIGIQGAGCLLAMLNLAITVYSHNPLLYPNQVDIQTEYLQIIFNAGIFGALFLVGSKKKAKSCGGCIAKKVEHGEEIIEEVSEKVVEKKDEKKVKEKKKGKK